MVITEHVAGAYSWELLLSLSLSRMFCAVEAGWGTFTISLTCLSPELGIQQTLWCVYWKNERDYGLGVLAFRQVETWEDRVCSGQAGF